MHKTLLPMIFLMLLCMSSPLLSEDNVLSSLDTAHPRLFLKNNELEHLKGQYKSDQALQKLVKDVLGSAQEAMKLPRLQHKLRGPRLLHVSRDCVRRIQALSMAYRWTGEVKYADKAVENMLVVCDFKDWNPSHFLDVAEMTHAVGLGYDWLYHYMDDDTRTRIRAGLIKNGLQEGIKAYDKKHWFTKTEFNWNQVCNGGLLIGALAIAESDPEYADRIVREAVKSLPRALKTYAPDGAWPEGPAYWRYASSYTAYGLSALETALGSDSDLSNSEGLARTALFPILACGPTGRYLCFADAGSNSSRKPMAVMFWMAKRYQDQSIANLEHETISRNKGTAVHLMWYQPWDRKARSSLPLDYLFRGPVPVTIFRSGWNNPNALFVGFKAGYNQVNHGHLDLGNFQIDALGIRWAEDLGSDNYNLPGYWDKKPGGKRWDYFRLNSLSHNVITINGQSQDADAKSRIETFHAAKDSGEDISFSIVDLTTAYKAFADKAKRGVALVDQRRAVIVQDEMNLTAQCDVRWNMITKTDIDIQQANQALLSQGGKKLTVRILSPQHATFTTASPEQEPPQASNKGYRQLVVKLKEATGQIQLTLLFSPHWEDGSTTTTVPIAPLVKWPSAYKNTRSREEGTE